ncbi:MAG: DUF378 domain-containing protein [Candidatus Woesearchaeota archaeon]
MRQIKNTLDWISMILLIVGGLNWGLVGLFRIDLVAAILNSVPVVRDIVYTLVGVAALYGIYIAAREE